MFSPTHEMAYGKIAKTARKKLEKVFSEFLYYFCDFLRGVLIQLDERVLVCSVLLKC